MHLIRSGSLEGFSDLVRELGNNPMTIMSEVGVNEAIFRNPNIYMSFNKVAELLKVASLQCEQPLFGMILAKRQQLSVFGILSQILRQQPTLEAAIKNINYYLHLHAQGIEIQTRIINGNVHLLMNFDFNCPVGYDDLIQMTVGHLFLFVSNLLPGHNMRVTSHVKQYAPHHSDHYLKSSNSHEVSFSQTFNGVSFHADFLKYELTTEDPHVIATAIKQEVFELYPNNIKFQIKGLIDRILPTGECNLEFVANNLEIHPRVLQSKLQSLNTSFSELLRETRLDVAKQYLQNDALSVTDLALKLGYAEVSIFSRNFKSWTGQSPREWQKINRIN